MAAAGSEPNETPTVAALVSGETSSRPSSTLIDSTLESITRTALSAGVKQVPAPSLRIGREHWKAVRSASFTLDGNSSKECGNQFARLRVTHDGLFDMELRLSKALPHLAPRSPLWLSDQRGF
jgi:hypothetical protein